MTDARRAGRLTVAWAFVILAFALVPAHDLLSSTVGDQETLTTEIGHFVEFAVLAALALWWATERAATRPAGAAGRRVQSREAGGPRVVRAAAVWTVAVAYGALIEVIQVPLGYRSAQAGDLAVNAAGALAGLLAFSCVRALRGRGRRGRAR
jgi:hypothetical protein